LQLGVLLAIAPRARRTLVPVLQEDGIAEEEEQQQPPSPLDQLLPLPPEDMPMPPPPSNEEIQAEEESTSEDEDTERVMEEEPTSEEDKDTSKEEEEKELLIPEQFMFGVDANTPVDPRLIQFQQWTRKGRGGKRSRIFNLLRGRFVKAIFPKGEGKGRIAVGATLRAAAPFQKYRREHAHDNRLVYIRDSDIRIKRLKRKAGSLIIFVVDASGSMALNRMGAAKGAAMTLLQEAYKGRDKICLIAFADDEASVVVPPTKSMALTKTRLEQMPCGGRSPLAHAMVTALRTGLNAIKVKQDVGKVVMVLITDGRPTVPLCVSEGEDFDASTAEPGDVNPDGQASRQYCRKEVYALAKQLGAIKDLDILVIDTEDKFVGTGVAKEISRLALGNYYSLDATKAADVAAVTRKHVEQTRIS
jgi:magnesium chelatase subunit D